MNSALFSIVAALALHHVLSCQVTTQTMSLLQLEEVIKVDYNSSMEQWNINVWAELPNISLYVFHKEDDNWKKIVINLCNDDDEFIIFRQILFGSTGFNSCPVTKGNYVGKSVIEYSDGVCTEISEKTNGNDDRLYFEFLVSSMTTIMMSIKIVHDKNDD